MVYYVMPYVEGESLRDRLNREKQLPVDQAVRIAREVLDALEYAHRKGIIHRDIKPENIMLHGGHALVADFGIALAASRSNDATRMTETGMSLGTPFYMAPEQAMGERDITARADIYALGCVLYEMLVAEPPFQGPTAQAIIARVMTEEPRRLTLQRRTIPPSVEAAVLTALAKLPADRFETAAQFAQALENPAYSSTATAAVAAWRPARTRRSLLVAAIPWVLLAVVGGILAWGKFTAVAGEPPPVLRFRLQLGVNATWEDQAGSALALSPDGRTLAYNGRDSTGTHIFLRPLDQLTPISISGTVGATQVSFSPNGRWIGYRKNDQIFRMPVTGGAAEAICKLGTGSPDTYSWLDERTVVVADGYQLRRCSMDNGFSPLYESADTTDHLAWPLTLPENRGILFTYRRADGFQLGVYDLRSNEARSLEIAGSNPRFVSGGYIVYGNLDGVIRAVPFDVDELTVTGDPIVVMQEVRVGSGGAAKMAVAPNGAIVAAAGNAGERVLELVDRAGGRTPLIEQSGEYLYPRFSPDGRQIAVVRNDQGTNIWLFDRGQKTLTRLTFDSGATRPSWTPSGRRVTYSRFKSAFLVDLRIINADGSAAAESLLTVVGQQLYQSVMTPDERTLVVRSTSSNGRDIWTVPLDSIRSLRPLLTSRADEVGFSLSPDGKWMAYASDESGRMEVYVRAFPGMGARYLVSQEGGVEPVWSRQGHEIFYRDGPAFMVATVRATPSFTVTSRARLFSDPAYTLSSFEQVYDVSPDGRHLVTVRSQGENGGLTVTLNWFDNLRASTR
jgi:serine/threonine-protein kinase